MNKSESIKNLAAALCKAQNEMSGAVKDSSNPYFKSKYADLGSVTKAIKEAFCNNGLSYSQFPIAEGDKVGVDTILMHSSGEYLQQSCLLPIKIKKPDPKFNTESDPRYSLDPQAAGSAITYARRYALQAIAGIPSEDDDGNKATFPNFDNKARYSTPAPSAPKKTESVCVIFNGDETQRLSIRKPSVKYSAYIACLQKIGKEYGDLTSEERQTLFDYISSKGGS